ncbi:hypothetical protein EB796_014433 [Bugula neritina]|uniref:Uncharacterized protein n=1 Tax=Bugula neritina TaxID=10212 RepID=A0A7J7JNP3_BUGNE|nr:hypothetical protein EB796_014433 [Bugula neritina]
MSGEEELLEKAIQKLEDNVLKGDEELTVQSEDGKGSEKVAARVRDIVTKSLTDNPAEAAMSSPSNNPLAEENRMLQAELNRLEDLLSQSRAERDEIGIKYNAVINDKTTAAEKAAWDINC